MAFWFKRAAAFAVVVPAAMAMSAAPAAAVPPAYALTNNYGTCIRVLQTLGFDPTFSELLTPAQFARAFDPLEINPSYPRSLSNKEAAVACDALYFFTR